MMITHTINNFLYILFPGIEEGNIEKLTETMRQFYTLGTIVPEISIKNDTVVVEIDTSSIILQDEEYHKAVSLCHNRKYAEAKPMLSGLIEKNPTISECHRYMGQILSNEGKQDDAINYLIDALRWDPDNAWAWLLVTSILNPKKIKKSQHL